MFEFWMSNTPVVDLLSQMIKLLPGLPRSVPSWSETIGGQTGQNCHRPKTTIIKKLGPTYF